MAVAGLMTGRLEAMTRLAQTHPEGAVLRLPTRRLVVASDPVTVRHVLVDHADRYAKGMGQAESAPWLGDGLLTAEGCLLYTSPSPRDLSTSRMPSSA